MTPITVLNVPPTTGRLSRADVVLDDDERKRAEPGSLEAREPSDHADDEQVDRGTDADRSRIDLAVPPDEEDAAERRDEPGDAEGQRPVERDVVAERAHAHRLVADALQREPERRSHEISEPDVDEHCQTERDVVEAVRMRVDVRR